MTDSGSMTDHDLIKVIEQAKKEWETAFDSIRDAIYIVSPDSRIVRSNLAFADFIGIDIRDVVGRTCCDFFPHHKDMGCPAKVRGRRTVEIEFKGPPRRFYQESVHPVMNSDNKIVVITDITALKLAELRTEKMIQKAKNANTRLQASMDKLKQTQAKLVETEKMASIAILAGRLAHEVNNPLGFIASNISTLKGYCQDTISILKMVMNHGITPDIEKLTQKADLEFIQSDYAGAAKEALDGVERISLILKAISDFVGADELAANIDLTKIIKALDIETGLPGNIYLEADLKQVSGFKGFRNSIRLAIRQVIENPIFAVQANETGKLEIALNETDDAVVLSIADNGIGMDGDTLKLALDPFYTTRAPGPHIGMGLSITHAVIERHNGTLDIESSSGQGTRVRMIFPLTAES